MEDRMGKKTVSCYWWNQWQHSTWNRSKSNHSLTKGGFTRLSNCSATLWLFYGKMCNMCVLLLLVDHSRQWCSLCQCFSTTVLRHTSVPWYNVHGKISQFHIMSWKNNKTPLWIDCALKGVWVYFPAWTPPRVSALCASKQSQVSHWERVGEWRRCCMLPLLGKHEPFYNILVGGIPCGFF